MIDLYTWTTPNGRKISILLEELGVDYTVHPVDISKGEQFAPEFLKISPNNKIPAIVDADNGLALMESGAIMLYLAQKYGQFVPKDPKARWQVVEWLMWQIAGLGPMLGQSMHFSLGNPGKSPYAEERYAAETERLFQVLDTQLAGRDYIVDDYSIADMACWPWVATFARQGIEISDYPNLAAWFNRIADRPAVQAGFHQPKEVVKIPRA